MLVSALNQERIPRRAERVENTKKIQAMDQFKQCRQHRFQSLEAVGYPGNNQMAKSTTTSASTIKQYCPLCKLNHPLYLCGKFLKMNPAERLRWVQQTKLCINYFKPDHQVKACSSRSCKRCSGKHNLLLHLNNKGEKLLNSFSPTTANLNISCTTDIGRRNLYGSS